MNKTQRIFINSENKDIDKHIKIKLEQSVKTLEFLSMSIDTNDIYQNFNSDYGVIVGRVIANNSIGVPNAKISIFIPLTDTDSTDPNIYSLYPYTTPRDVNNEGKRYNLLPRVGKYNSDGSVRPPQPFGSLPIKEEIVVNEEFLNVYKKYYKYTATTNDSGDYMIFGVPIGTQTVHMSVDITDIGKYSMSPASMIKSLGYSENLFINQTIIKPSNDLNDLPHIETQEVGVDIIPFWGDTTNFEIGITRQDFKIRTVLANTFTLFASVFTDADDVMWGTDFYDNSISIGELYRSRSPAEASTSISTKRIGNITENIYYYPSDVSDNDINNSDPNIADPINNMLLLDKSQYSIYKRDGDFVIIINCNRDKIINDEYGNEIHVSNDHPNGIFTTFKGFLTIEITPTDIPMSFNGSLGRNALGAESKIVPYRYKLKFPQYAERGHSFSASMGSDNNDTKIWRKKHYTFNAGKFYSLARFHGTVKNETRDRYGSDDNGFFSTDIINDTYNQDIFWNTGIITTGSIGEFINTNFEFPSNSLNNFYNINVFGANWLNLSVYLPQFAYVTNEFSKISYIRTADNFSRQITDLPTANAYYNEDNKQIIAAKVENTKWFARADLHWTDIIEVPKTDIQSFKQTSKKGFNSNEVITGYSTTFSTENYRNGVNLPTNWITPCPINGGKINGNPVASSDNLSYFYKGVGNSNCIEYLFYLGLIL